MKRIIVPIEMRDFPEQAIEHLYAYGIEEEQLLQFLVQNYSRWESSTEECLSLCEWFLNQQGALPGQDGNGHDVVGPADDWLEWADTLRLTEEAVQFFKRQIDRYLRLEGHEGPNWPPLVLERTIGYDLVLTYRPREVAAYAIA